jgi:hypothetical protein
MLKTDETLSRDHEDPELCPHGYPEGRGCEECEYWERVDYEYDRHKDK